MVGPVGHKKRGGLLAGIYGGNQGDIGKVGSSLKWVIQDDHVPLPPACPLDGGLYGHRHGSQVDGYVGRLCDHVTRMVKDGTGEVAPLFDVGGKGGPGQGNPHLL